MARRDHIAYFLAKLEERDKVAYRTFLAAVQGITDEVVLARLADAILSGDTEQVIRVLGLSDVSFSALHESIRETYVTGAQSSIVGLRPKGYGARLLARFNIRNPEAEAWLAEAAARRVTGYLQEARLVIKDALEAGLQGGQSPLTTARQLVGVLKAGTSYRKGGSLLLTRSRAATVWRARYALQSGDTAGMLHYLTLGLRDRRFDSLVRKAAQAGIKLKPEKVEQIIGFLADNYLKERSKLIARTETLSAMNAGKYEAFRQATVSQGIDPRFISRQWDSTGDKRVRPDHQHLDGQKVQGLLEPYRLPDGGIIMRPGDMEAGVAQVANCRCLEYLEVDWFQGRAS